MNLPPVSHPGQSSRRREGAGRAEGKRSAQRARGGEGGTYVAVSGRWLSCPSAVIFLPCIHAALSVAGFLLLWGLSVLVPVIFRFPGRILQGSIWRLLCSCPWLNRIRRQIFLWCLRISILHPHCQIIFSLIPYLNPFLILIIFLIFYFVERCS